MLLSEYIESLQITLKNNGDAQLYTLDEVGFKVDFYDFIEPYYKVVQEAYYDNEKDEFVDAKYTLNYYLIS